MKLTACDANKATQDTEKELLLTPIVGITMVRRTVQPGLKNLGRSRGGSPILLEPKILR